MKSTLLLVAAVLAAWLALAPPSFTNGACTAEFDAESVRLEASAQALRSSGAAGEYFSSRSVPYQVITTEQCRRAKPRFLARCADGPLMVAKVAVQNDICRIYRDSAIAVRLQLRRSRPPAAHGARHEPLQVAAGPVHRRGDPLGPVNGNAASARRPSG